MTSFSTLAAFYIIFPILLPTLETYSNNMLTLLIVIMYHFQCLPYMLSILVTSNVNLESYEMMHPLFRLPVFIMGCATGLLLLRGNQYPQENYGVIYDIFPWMLTSSDTFVTKSASSWGRRVDKNSSIICLFILYVFVQSAIFPSLPKLDIYVLFFLCHVQLVVIIGLIQDHSSFTAKLCR